MADAIDVALTAGVGAFAITTFVNTMGNNFSAIVRVFLTMLAWLPAVVAIRKVIKS